MKNLKLIEKKITLAIIYFYITVCLFALLKKDATIFYSLNLGIGFSYLSLKNLFNSGAQIISKKESSLYFKNQFIRLGLVAIPVAISLAWKNSFNLPIILLSLFAFQGCFIIFEIVKSVKKIRKFN